MGFQCIILYIITAFQVLFCQRQMDSENFSSLIIIRGAVELLTLPSCIIYLMVSSRYGLLFLFLFLGLRRHKCKAELHHHIHHIINNPFLYYLAVFFFGDRNSSDMYFFTCRWNLSLR